MGIFNLSCGFYEPDHLMNIYSLNDQYTYIDDSNWIIKQSPEFNNICIYAGHSINKQYLNYAIFNMVDDKAIIYGDEQNHEEYDVEIHDILQVNTNSILNIYVKVNLMSAMSSLYGTVFKYLIFNIQLKKVYLCNYVSFQSNCYVYRNVFNFCDIADFQFANNAIPIISYTDCVSYDADTEEEDDYGYTLSSFTDLTIK